MSNFPRSLIVTCSFAAALGFLAGRFTSPKPLAETPPVAQKSQSSQHADATTLPFAAPETHEPKASQARLLATLETMEPPSNERGFHTLLETLQSLAATDPKAALDYVRRHVPASRQDEMLSAILSAWTQHNPQEAWNWVVANTPENVQQVDAVLSEIGKTDPGTAWNFATQLATSHPSADAQGIYVSALRGILYSGNYQEAASLVGSAAVPSEQGKYDLSSLVASQWANYEPARAAAWVMTLPDGLMRTQALISLAQSWSAVDPQAAANFAAQLPSSTVRTQALNQALDHWIEQDPAKAGDWLNQFPSNPDFDQAMLKIATAPLVISDAKAAMSWAEAITDTEFRRQAQTRIIGDWMDRDRTAAQTYLQSTTDLSPEARTDILERIQRRTVER